MEILPRVILLTDARRERPPHVCLRVVVALCRDGKGFLTQVHATRRRTAFPVEYFALGVLLRAQEHVALGAFAAVVRLFASQQDGLVARKVAEDRHDVHVGLQVVESFAIDRKIFVGLQQIPAEYLSHCQMKFVEKRLDASL